MSNKNLYEIERKYLIKYPDIDLLKACENYNATEIWQTYLKNSDNTTGMRIRKRGNNNSFEYTKTFKRDITPLKRIEIEDVITEQEYEQLLKEKDKNLHSIHKFRHCFNYMNQMFELDVYTFWNDRATLELELSREDQKIILPPFIEIIKEVTNDKRYRNRSLAQSVITEDF